MPGVSQPATTKFTKSAGRETGKDMNDGPPKSFPAATLRADEVDVMFAGAGDGRLASPDPMEAAGTAQVSTIAGLRAALANTSITTILIAPGTYRPTDHDVNSGYGNTAFFVGRNVTIKVDAPIGGRADFYAGADFNKGIFLVGDGASATFDGIGFFDTRVNGPYSVSNEAGIRHEGVDLTIRNSFFQNNNNGVLAAPLPGRAEGRRREQHVRQQRRSGRRRPRAPHLFRRQVGLGDR